MCPSNHMSSTSADVIPTRYQCSQCHKAYTHSTHLRRHERTHDNARLLKCPFCEKPFSRADIVRRHTKICPKRDASRSLSPDKRGRKPQSCDSCLQTKSSCDRGTPCRRCYSGGLPCSYLRRDTATYSFQSIIPQAERSYGPVVSCGRAEISFLLRLTDPSIESITEVFSVEAAQVEDLHSEDFRDAEPGQEAYGEQWPLDYSSPIKINENLYDTESSQQKSVWLEGRMERIITELSTSYTREHRQNFDIESAQSLFTVKNLREFTSAYFRGSHRQMPLLHRPTFDIRRVSLPLLLAIFLAGSAYSAPMDHVISARQFLRPAEDYIHHYLSVLPIAAYDEGGDEHLEKRGVGYELKDILHS
ncbi:hypothetical protein B0J12DRAFT_349831 [Macrophomina phaseolina]|uniref:Zn(2)-C6 fungal-type domain-containing protein n=1 Tax=Macrophomina phaseolina TaxID=35725 RepID=A0ABQ8GQS4_9PEZI|nr:hypothetical protein B0J12DRAFT_349831 [Macrophomina phaseolina]